MSSSSSSSSPSSNRYNGSNTYYYNKNYYKPQQQQQQQQQQKYTPYDTQPLRESSSLSRSNNPEQFSNNHRQRDYNNTNHYYHHHHHNQYHNKHNYKSSYKLNHPATLSNTYNSSSNWNSRDYVKKPQSLSPPSASVSSPPPTTTYSTSLNGSIKHENTLPQDINLSAPEIDSSLNLDKKDVKDVSPDVDIKQEQQLNNLGTTSESKLDSKAIIEEPIKTHSLNLLQPNEYQQDSQTPQPIETQYDNQNLIRPLTKLQSDFEQLKANFNSLSTSLQKSHEFQLNRRILIKFKIHRNRIVNNLKRRNDLIANKKLKLDKNYQALTEKCRIERSKMDQQLKILNKNNQLKQELETNVNNSNSTQPTTDKNGVNLPTISSRRSSRRHGDLITSEAEFQEILLSLGKENDDDPLIKAEKVAATIPDLIIDPIKRDRVLFMDSNNIVVDKLQWSQRVKTDFQVSFNQKEHELFTEGFCLYPKRFGAISRHMGGLRSANDCVFYYYQTKKIHNYKELVVQFRKKASKKGRKSKKYNLNDGKLPINEIEAPNSNIGSMTVNGSSETSTTPIELQPIITPEFPNTITYSEELYTDTGRRKRAAAPSFEKKSIKKPKTPKSELHNPNQFESESNTVEEIENLVTVEVSPIAMPSDTTSPVTTDDKRKAISSYWSITEANAFPKLLEEYGTRWTVIADKIQTKSTTMVRNYYSRNAEKNNWIPIAEQADSKLNLEPVHNQTQPIPFLQSSSQIPPLQSQPLNYSTQPIASQPYVPYGVFPNAMPGISNIITKQQQQQQPPISYQPSHSIQQHHVNPSIKNLLSEPVQPQSQPYSYYAPPLPIQQPQTSLPTPPTQKSSIMSLLNSDSSPVKQEPPATRPKTKLHDLLNGPEPMEPNHSSPTPPTNKGTGNNNNGNAAFKRSGIASLLSD